MVLVFRRHFCGACGRSGRRSYLDDAMNASALALLLSWVIRATFVLCVGQSYARYSYCISRMLRIIVKGHRVFPQIQAVSYCVRPLVLAAMPLMWFKKFGNVESLLGALKERNSVGFELI